MRPNFYAMATIACLSLTLAAPAMAAPETLPGAAEVDLRAAVRAALEHTSGHVLEAEREREDGKHIYEIDIVQDGKITEVNVDVATGKVVGAETDDVENRVKALLLSRKKLDALKAAKVSLSDAVAKAEEEMKAKAVEAEFKHEDGKYVYEIELKADGGRIEALVDADTGAVRKD